MATKYQYQDVYKLLLGALYKDDCLMQTTSCPAGRRLDQLHPLAAARGPRHLLAVPSREAAFPPTVGSSQRHVRSDAWRTNT